MQTSGEPVNLNLPLTPASTAAADYVVEIGPDGFEPSYLSVPSGSVIQWINADIGDHTSTSISPTLSGPGTPGNGGWDSGRLSSSDNYVLQFAGQGIFTYADRANPSHTAQIQVRNSVIYLPLVQK